MGSNMAIYKWDEIRRRRTSSVKSTAELGSAATLIQRRGLNNQRTSITSSEGSEMRRIRIDWKWRGYDLILQYGSIHQAILSTHTTTQTPWRNRGVERGMRYLSRNKG